MDAQSKPLEKRARTTRLARAVGLLAVPVAFSITTMCADISGVGGIGALLSGGLSGLANQFSVSVSVTGHAGGAGMVITNSTNGNTITGITTNGTHAFSQTLTNGSGYDIQITTQPAGQTCVLTGGTGTIAGAAVIPSIACPGSFDIGGAVGSFASGTDLVLRESVSGLTQSITAGASTYSFSTSLLDTSSYQVIVQSQPTTPNRTCSLTNAAGTISGAHVTNINVACVAGQIVGGTIFTPPTFTTNLLSTFAGDPPGSGPTSGGTDAAGTAARFDAPQAIATDGTNLYVLDEGSDSLRKIVIATGVVTTVWTDGSKSPEFLTTDGNYVYMVDRNAIARVEIATGTYSILAGDLITTGYLDATGIAARFDTPGAITTDGTNLYVSDRSNNRVRRIVIATAVVTTLAGDGTTGVLNMNAGPVGITTDGTFVYVVDVGNNRIRKIRASDGAFIDNIAVASAGGITTDGTNLYMTTGNQTILKYDALVSGGSFTTLVGGAGAGFVDGALGVGRVNSAFDITTDGNALYIADRNNHAIRKYK